MTKTQFVKSYRKRRQLQKSDDPSTSPKSFVQAFKKSYDYRDLKVEVSSSDQFHAETTVDRRLVDFLKSANQLKQSEIATFSFNEGQLTLSKKDENLFSGFYKDGDGQIVERFDDKTLEIVAKTLLVKNLIFLPSDPSTDEEHEDDDPTAESPAYVRVKFGDFELELRKSLEAFKSRKINNANVKKSLRIFRKATQDYTNVKDDKETIQEILENWDIHRERFNQILFAVEQIEKANKA